VNFGGSQSALLTETATVSLGSKAQSSVYVIASTNRTGSYLLCEGLKATNLAGHPTESLYPEYRDAICLRYYGREMDLSESINMMMRHECTPNGVFGVKVHWDQVENIAFESGYDGGPPHAFLLKEFPGARYIHIFRQDTLAQAVSLSIALQTGKWWHLSYIENPCIKLVPPVFDAEKILHLEQDLIRQRDAWEAFFALEGITPLRMDYETLVADYRGEVERVLEFLELDSAVAHTIPDPKMQKQGDALNALWLSWLRPILINS